MSVPYTFGTNTYAQSGQIDANFAALNSSLSNIDASQITTGTLPVARGGTGANTAPAALTSLGAVAKAGDTMTGNLSGTTAAFSGTVTVGAIAVSGVNVTPGQLFVAGGNIGSVPAHGPSGMQGLGYQHTMVNQRVLVILTGSVACDTAGVTISAFLMWGTGTPPAHGAAQTGTSLNITQLNGFNTGAQVPCPLFGAVSASPGTVIWYDVYLSISTGNSTYFQTGQLLFEI